ncbi:DUF998 domain-containing protein [Promethearchaeum syntrophicum]|uniref:DUF998 domain-containing protein n=1 Tax=Promethearchaeum syntrophicum TaxID=2594042 RepID=A0A5B9D8F8_9ARCH|nr:DUF998 domain-containing protein [Candidatus Prometheoarchaeum syntrophicum]QEE15538.1 hypothetical protein DSAG12_01364 [Candidatus Prometheoarchaeum syntrophicum]
MDKNKLKQWALFAPVIGSSLFFILTIIAMFTFAGGYMFEPTSPGYSLINNFFSDLGMITGYSGDSNMVSSTLFLMATLFCGLLMMPYFAVIPSIFKSNRINYILIILGSTLGFIAAIGYIGIGFTPWDKSEASLSAHMFFVYLAFPLTLPVVICYVTAFLQKKDFPRILSYIYIIMGVILVVYLYLLFFGPSAGTEIGRIIQVVGQKVIVYAEILTFWIQGYYTSKYFKNKEKIKALV